MLGEKVWVAPNGLHIALAQNQDASAMAQLHAEGFFRGWSEDELTTYIERPDDHICFVSCDAKRAVSGFMVLRHIADEVELMTITVGKKHRGKGLGAALLRAGFDDLLHRPAKTMFLEVAENNASAIHLYKTHGFETISRRAAYYEQADGHKATALVMRRQLA